MKNINKTGIIAVAGLMFATASCSDYSDYNTVPEDALPTANNTLWQNISENEQLQDFTAIIAKAGYANTLSSSRFYTLWAPVDGTYDAQAVLSKDSAAIVREFIEHHMTDYNHPVTGEVNERIVSLNDKHHDFTNTSFDNVAIERANIASSNGVIHFINGRSMFYPNLYEEVDNLEGCDAFKNFIQKYDEYYLDVENSVIGPMVNGQQTYLDSVFKKRNNIISRILNAQLENEDSSYTMLYPTDVAWETAYSNISPNYNYIAKLDYMNIVGNATTAANLTATTAKNPEPVEIDAELYKDSLTKNSIVRYLAYSNTDERNNPIWSGELNSQIPDTLKSTTDGYITNVRDIFNHTVGDVQKSSNGYYRIIDSLCLKSWETYEPVRTYMNPIRVLGLRTNSNATKYNVVKNLLAGRDTLFEKVPVFIKKMLLPEQSQLFTYISTDAANFANTTARPELDFALRDVQSTKYHIFVVTVPAQVSDPYQPLKPTYLRFDMSYTDAAGTQRYQRLNVPGANRLTDDIIAEAGKLNVIELEFEFPVCYNGLSAFPTLFMSHTKTFGTSSNRNRYDQELRVAGIYLVPERAYEYMKNITE